MPLVPSAHRAGIVRARRIARARGRGAVAAKTVAAQAKRSILDPGERKGRGPRRISFPAPRDAQCGRHFPVRTLVQREVPFWVPRQGVRGLADLIDEAAFERPRRHRGQRRRWWRRGRRRYGRRRRCAFPCVARAKEIPPLFRMHGDVVLREHRRREMAGDVLLVRLRQRREEPSNDIRVLHRDVRRLGRIREHVIQARLRDVADRAALPVAVHERRAAARLRGGGAGSPPSMDPFRRSACCSACNTRTAPRAR